MNYSNNALWVAKHKGANLEKINRPLEKLLQDDVLVKVKYCGLCHSDIHIINDDWGGIKYPVVPGHEIIGEVVDLGKNVSNLKKGDFVGIGWQGGSCGTCIDCTTGHENFCEESKATCLSVSGGFAEFHITKKEFCFKLSSSLVLAETAPLFCGGITVYSPLREFLNNQKKRVGIVGLGGLGHMAVKFAKKMGNELTVFSHTKDKAEEAARLGASNFVFTDLEQNNDRLKRKLDFILVTSNANPNMDFYLNALDRDGTLCFVGIPPDNISLGVFQLLGKRLRISASPIGSPSEIRGMLDFVEREGVFPEIESFSMSEINLAIEKLKKNQVKYRAVLEN
ncbi:MAG: NAD(P)-dependent alcohol dehydrogenase [Oligoflexia bacterium]|nr:NAD(P)-dependent alcohol dehydrogenase [Oligoflexia bacterium]